MQLAIPKNNPVRVYYTLSLASIMYSSFEPDDKSFTLNGTDIELIRFMWTAMMILGPTKYPGFSYKNITTKCAFDPKPEFGWFATFGSASLHDTVFLPILAGQKIAYIENENEKEFGHLVPDTQPDLKAEVIKLWCHNYIDTNFEIKDKIIEFRYLGETKTVPALQKLLKTGRVKLTQALATLDPSITDFHYPLTQYALSSEAIETLLGSLPASIKTLRASYLSLNSANAAMLPKLFACPNITTLNISKNELGKLNAKVLAKAIREVGKKLYYVIASENELNKLGVAGLVEFLSAPPANVRAITLNENNFDFFTGQELATILKAVPITVNYVGLSQNNLARLKLSNSSSSHFKELAIAFGGLHNSVETLLVGSLALNRLDNNEINDLVAAIKKLPKSIKKLYVDDICTTPELYAQSIANKYDKTIADNLKKEIGFSSAKLHELCSKFETRVADVSKVIAAGVDLNYKDSSDGSTALMCSLGVNNDAVSEFLLGRGANPFVKNNTGEIASKLVSRNALIYPILKGYELLSSVSSNNVAMVNVLLNNNVNNLVDFQGADGSTAIMLAAEQALPDMVAALLAHNPNIFLSNETGKTVFDLAKKPNILKMLNDYQSAVNLNVAELNQVPNTTLSM